MTVEVVTALKDFSAQTRLRIKSAYMPYIAEPANEVCNLVEDATTALEAAADRIEALEKAFAYIDIVEAEAFFLAQALAANDPKPQMKVRIDDIIKILNAARAASTLKGE